MKSGIFKILCTLREALFIDGERDNGKIRMIKHIKRRSELSYRLGSPWKIIK